MGTSRYEPLVKLKKKSLDSTESSLIAANNALSHASNKVAQAYDELSQMKLPEYGTVGELIQFSSMIHAQQMTIEKWKQTMHAAQQKQNQMRERFKAAMIEYEKFKYLDVQEMNARLKKLKRDEAKMLDEIGTMIYKKGQL
jgi:flagellar export protein FliJ